MSRALPKKIQDQITYSYPGEKFVQRPKYSNRSCVCWEKHIHQSILESDYCNHLTILKRSKEIRDFKIQHKIEIWVKDEHICNHIVDFLVLKAGGISEYHEVKGMETEVWKIKRRLVQALFPGIPYIVKYEKTKFFKGRR